MVTSIRVVVVYVNMRPRVDSFRTISPHHRGGVCAWTLRINGRDCSPHALLLMQHDTGTSLFPKFVFYVASDAMLNRVGSFVGHALWFIRGSNLCRHICRRAAFGDGSVRAHYLSYDILILLLSSSSKSGRRRDGKYLGRSCLWPHCDK